MKTTLLRAPLALAALAALRCVSLDESAGGSPEPMTVTLAERNSERISGELWADAALVEFTSTPSAPRAGAVAIHVTSFAETPAPALDYELRYDYAAGRVTSDGHGDRLDRDGLAQLRAAADAVAAQLDTAAATSPLHAQMLAAAFVLLSESGGMPLTPLTFELDAPADGALDKSLEDDGVDCISRGETVLGSFDFGRTVVVDEPFVADSHSCNGRCGPSCTQLTAFEMWTLDCLEHDECCTAIGDRTTCFTPLGECGDEYVDAETDFLRGFDLFSRHCDG
jgi:hypothetical protein